MKSYTDIEQSKKLSEILPIESADMHYSLDIAIMEHENIPTITEENDHFELFPSDIPCWSLAALLKILHRNEKDIVTLFYGVYKDGKYILNWCLDYESENCEYIKTFGDDSVDACVEMILKLNKLDLL